MRAPVFHSPISLLPPSKIEIAHLIGLKESSFKCSDTTFPLCLPELFIWGPGPAAVYCEVSTLKGMGSSTHWEGTHSGDTKERGEGKTINKVSMFLKWKTSDFGKHAITCGEHSNIQRENLLPCWRAGVKSAEKNTVLNFGTRFILAHILSSVCYFFLLANDTFAWKAQSSSCTFSCVTGFVSWPVFKTRFSATQDGLHEYLLLCPWKGIKQQFQGRFGAYYW